MPYDGLATYLLDHDESIYTKILELLPATVADFDIDRWCHAVKELVPADRLDRRIQQSIRKTGVEYSSDIEDVVPRGHTLANTNVSRRGLISAACVYAEQLPRWAFQRDLELEFQFGYYYQEPLPGRLPIRFGSRIREGMVILYTASDNDYSLSTLWSDIERQCRGNYYWPHENDLVEYPHKISSMKYSSCVSQFLRLLFTMNLPLSEIEAWYDSLTMKHCVGDLHKKSYLDAHFTMEPFLTAILFFLKLEKQEEQFKQQGRVLVATGFNCVGLGLATGAADQRNPHSKKTREIVRGVLSTMGLLEDFAENGDYPFRPNIPGVFPPNLGQFIRAKRFIGTDVYKAIIGRLLSAATSHYGSIMGSPADIVYYGAYNIKFLLGKHNARSLFTTGLLAQQQYIVDYKLLKVSRTGRQAIPEREWETVINSNVNSLKVYYDNPDNRRMTVSALCPAVLPPFGQLYYGQTLLEKVNNYKFSETYGAPTAGIPRLLDADVEDDLDERIADFWNHVPRRHCHDVIVPPELGSRDPRNESLYSYVKRTY